MTILNEHRFRGLRQLWRSGEGPALLASLVFCVVTSVFMAPLLPAEEGFGAVGVLFIYATVFVLWLLAAFTHLTLLILGNSVAVLLKITSVTFEFGTVALPLLFQGVYTGGEWAVYVLVAAVKFLFSAVIATGELSWDVLFTVGDIVLNGSIVLGHLLAVVVTSVWFWVTTALFWAAAMVHSGVEFVVLLPWATVIGQTMSVILDCSTFIWTWFIVV